MIATAAIKETIDSVAGHPSRDTSSAAALTAFAVLAHLFRPAVAGLLRPVRESFRAVIAEGRRLRAEFTARATSGRYEGESRANQRRLVRSLPLPASPPAFPPACRWLERGSRARDIRQGRDSLARSGTPRRRQRCSHRLPASDTTSHDVVGLMPAPERKRFLTHAQPRTSCSPQARTAPIAARPVRPWLPMRELEALEAASSESGRDGVDTGATAIRRRGAVRRLRRASPSARRKRPGAARR